MNPGDLLSDAITELSGYATLDSPTGRRVLNAAKNWQTVLEGDGELRAAIKQAWYSATPELMVDRVLAAITEDSK